MNWPNSKHLRNAALVWFAVFTLYEVVDSYQWMTQTSSMFTEHPALGEFHGYETAMNSDDASLQRLPIILGKWIGMAKYFLTGALLALLLFGSNRARAFLLGWNFIALMIMSMGLYPTLDEIALAFPEDYSNGFSTMSRLETTVGVLCGIFCLVAIASEVLVHRESRPTNTISVREGNR